MELVAPASLPKDGKIIADERGTDATDLPRRIIKKPDFPGRSCYAAARSRMPAAVRLILPQLSRPGCRAPRCRNHQFRVIGLGNTVIDLAIFTLAYQVLKLPLVPANVIAWLGGRIVFLRDEHHDHVPRRIRPRIATEGLSQLRRLGCARRDRDHHDVVALSHFMPVYAAKLLSIWSASS